jgi:hypothetical protein
LEQISLEHFEGNKKAMAWSAQRSEGVREEKRRISIVAFCAEAKLKILHAI